MMAEVGHIALCIAFAISLWQAIMVLPFWKGTWRQTVGGECVHWPLSYANAALVTLSMAALMAVYATSDFSVHNVFANSHTEKPLIYKITGTWGNHEGSMLLWVMVLVWLTAALAWFSRHETQNRIVVRTLGMQGLLQAAFLAFVLGTSNPFWRMWPAPLEGQDLNPVLQDPGLIIHPPLLYIGYVGFALTFSFAIAALWEGDVNRAWAQRLRPWTLLAWVFLTLGIAMGSYWAYYELGWGGFWFWDPVENASLVPWLLGTALIHCLQVTIKRDALKIWTVLLALLTFSASLMGTFLVRSGVLTSVHSFASDPTRGIFILALVAGTMGLGFCLFVWRIGVFRSGEGFHPVSREGALIINNLFLMAAAVTVFVGTLYPLGLEAITGQKISVGEPFFNLTVLPLMIPLVALLPWAQRLSWKRANVGSLLKREHKTALGALALYALLEWAAEPTTFSQRLWLLAGAAIIAGGVREWFLNKTWTIRGTAIAHIGVGLTTIGIAAHLGHKEELAFMRPTETLKIGAYEMKLTTLENEQGPNYDALRGHFSVMKAERVVGVIKPARRLYRARQMPTTEAGLLTRGLSQIYVALGEIEGDKIAVRAQHKPLVLLIWLGGIAMAAGGTMTMVQRRRFSVAKEKETS